jgi:ribulose-phosphate 3-epimerase
MLKPKFSASMMCANYLNLEKDVVELEKAAIDYLHFDIMDGVFVPNIMLCNEMIKSLRKITKIPFDIHLMITNPEQKIKWFDMGEGDIISVHYESTPHIHRALQEIKSSGAKAAIALNPATPVCCIENVLQDVDMVLLMTVNPGFAGQKLIEQTLDKIKKTREMLDNNGFENIILQVDGNCSFENIPKMYKMGADCFVTGSSSVFDRNYTIADSVKRLKKAVAE